PAPLSLARVTIPEQQSVIHGAGRPSSADRRGPYAPVRPYAATGIRGGQYGQINQDPRVSAWLYRRSSTSVRRAVTSLAATSPNPTSPPISPRSCAARRPRSTARRPGSFGTPTPPAVFETCSPTSVVG